jgi:hypothetical protein
MLTTKMNTLEAGAAQSKNSVRESDGAYTLDASVDSDWLFDQADYST